ncbi:MAG: thioredoxin family protein [Chitinophagaceae bacterium]|nr:thioredoxin family protein [Chitinophagaceae bacterium]
MKKIISLYFATVFVITLLAQTNAGKGIQFYEGSWKEALKTAGKADKMIFIDISTDWCGPCIYMEKFIFTKQAVGKKYNEAFLNYKIDAEKGEGVDIARKYEVSAYPTFLFVNSSGYLIYKHTGERDEAGFMGLVQEAKKQDADPNNLGKMKQIFDEGNRDSSFLRLYLNRLAEMQVNNGEVLDAYFNMLTDEQLRQDSTLLYLLKYMPGTQTAFSAYFINHYDQLTAASKAKLTDFLFDRIVRTWGGTALSEKRLPEYVTLRKFADKLDGLGKGERTLLNRIDLKYGVLVRDYDLIKKAGYLHTDGLLSIPVDSIRREDKRRAEKMQSVISGEKDSAKMAAFEEEREFWINIYSREIYSPLYEAADAFTHLPSTEKQALKDALAWAQRCSELMPGIGKLNNIIEALEMKINE